MLKKLIFSCCFVLAMVVIAFPVSAAPVYTPFLKVDINGQAGPTQAGWESWNFDRNLTTNTFTNTFGGVTITLTAVNGAAAMPGSRNRGEPTPTGPDDAYLSNVYEDFFFIGHVAGTGLGRDYLRFDFVDLAGNTEYEFTFYSYDMAFNNASEIKGSRWIAWGTVNPAEWLDTNVSPGYAYPATNDAPDPGTYKNPIPTLARAQNGAGPYPPVLDNPYAYSASFMATTDEDGRITIYGWSDLDDWTGSQHTPVNGFTIGMIPEPATIALLGLGGLALLRRKQ